MVMKNHFSVFIWLLSYLRNFVRIVLNILCKLLCRWTSTWIKLIRVTYLHIWNGEIDVAYYLKELFTITYLLDITMFYLSILITDCQNITEIKGLKRSQANRKPTSNQLASLTMCNQWLVSNHIYLFIAIKALLFNFFIITHLLFI